VILFDVAAALPTVGYDLARPADLEATAREVEALGRRAVTVIGDVRRQSDLDDAVAQGISQFGHIDILIANAGIWVPGAFFEMTDEQWEETIGINLTGVWHSAKAVAKHMIDRQSGSIILISSMNGLEGATNNSPYAAAKHGVLGLMKCIALEMAPHGVRCNAICPGSINTPMTNNPYNWDRFAGHEGGTEADMLESGRFYHALKGASFLSPQVIADTALYLSSDLAAFVTGIAVPVDAGHMVLPGVNRNPASISDDPHPDS
jgi:NAD(P)-dependent dehydrogenase (short-subunit alcohol dehydrogenase family)